MGAARSGRPAVYHLDNVRCLFVALFWLRWETAKNLSISKKNVKKES